MENKEILRLWKDLVIAVGTTKPRSDDMEYINHNWCPDGTSNAKFLRELRPQLKEILHQSLSGELMKEGFDTKITRKIQFKLLMNEIHQNIEIADYDELLKWSRYNVSGVKKEMWSSIGSESKRHLAISLSRYFSFKEKMDALNNKMKIWIEEHRSKLNDLEEVVELNSDLALEKHKQQLDLSEKRLNDVMIIRSKLPDLINAPVHGLKNKMRQEIVDAIFSGSECNKIPDWAGEIDSVKMEQNMVIMNKFMELEIKTPENKIDNLVSELADLMNGPVSTIIMNISEIELEKI
jgi:hypothetical protein